jgi:hypothetical protein
MHPSAPVHGWQAAFNIGALPALAKARPKRRQLAAHPVFELLLMAPS